MTPTYLLVSLMFLAVFTATEGGMSVGGWSPMQDLSDPHIQEIAEFAVNQYNKLSMSLLKFERIVAAESQVVAGMRYKVVVEVDENNYKRLYEADVWEEAWMHSIGLNSFVPLN